MKRASGKLKCLKKEKGQGVGCPSLTDPTTQEAAEHVGGGTKARGPR